jgi:endoglucanase
MTTTLSVDRRQIISGLALTLGSSLAARRGLAEQPARGGTCASDIDAPWTKFGINIVGPALAPNARGKFAKDYIYPDDNSLAYYRSKGMKVARITFLWERLQPKLFADLDRDELGRMRELVEMAHRHQMVLIIGPHNYARYAVKDGAPQLIGSEAVPTAAFVDFWERVSEAFAREQDGLIFSLMNEPHDTGGTWHAIAQAAVDTIRKHDAQRWIYVAGDGWSSARSWREYNQNLAIADKSDRIVYVAHQYFDASGQGTYPKNYDDDGAYPQIGSERLKPFLDWLRERRVRGTVTEYGVPNSDPRWLVVLDNALASLRDANVGGAYWAGGPWWGNYPLSSEPKDGKDAPVMSILSKYATPCAASNAG